MLTCSFDEAAQYSRERRESLAQWRGSFSRDSFGWVVPPVLNPYTRLAVEMCPARGAMRVIGYELVAGAAVAEPATQPRQLVAEAVAA